jgi:uncharacterized repeat protein (TIGR03803 family)
MQSKSRFPLPRAALSLALIVGLALPLGFATTAAAASAKANVSGLLALGTSSTVGTGIRADLILGTDGNFYAAASAGGDSSVGTIMRITPTGTATLVHSLAGPSTEGYLPYGALLQATDGFLYGTSYRGGSRDLGTAFKVGTDGTFTNLYSFDNASQGGFLPYGGLVQVGADLYGTTLRGGPSDAGTVFKLTTGGTLTVLASFDGSNGKNPEGRLALGPDGALYGTTLIGGANDRGVVFRISTSGTLTTLFSFPALTSFNAAGVATNIEGSNPRAGLTLGADGNFYGTAYQGGATGYGTVFRITPTGSLTVLRSFAGAPFEGAFPLSTVGHMPDGSLVGTTEKGGSTGAGTAWRIDPTGAFTTLHSFSGQVVDGAQPFASLFPLNGALYGATYTDSAAASGVFFKLDLPTNGVLPVSLTSTPDTIALGASSTVAWTSSGAASCASAGNFGDATVALTGSQTVTPTSAGIYNYVITCTDGAGVAHSASVPLVVNAAALEPIDAGGDGGGGSFPILGLALLAGTLGLSLVRKHFPKDAA